MYNNKNKKNKKKADDVDSPNVVHEGNAVRGCIIVKIHKDKIEIKTMGVQRKA